MRRALPLLLALWATPTLAQDGVGVTWLWHLEQPIYWPAPNAGGDRYETALDSLVAKRAGAAHPQNDLEEIFSKADRVAVYQGRVRDAVDGLRGLADAGAQVSYSGGLIENIQSLGGAGELGYGGGWADGLRTARGWTTSGGHPRVDVVQFPFHHALSPLVDPEVLRMELRLYQAIYPEAWGPVRQSRGFFPSEMAFAEHIIPVLAQEGIEWTVVSNHHLSRACADYPWVAGSGGDNIPPPNRADQLNPAQGEGAYNRIAIDRGVAPANAVPFAYQAHRAQHVDPATGEVHRVIVVPAAQAESWQDGYACFGAGAVDALRDQAGGGQGMLLLLAHDGDNAFGGGFSYYHECTPTFAQQAAERGHHVTTVQQHLADHPVPADDVVRVESGAWVNADGDFGAPTFWNWNWPLVDAQGQVDIANGWAEDERNWAVIVAATQEVRHATALRGAPPIGQVLHPERGADALAKAWHFLLGGLNSGYMYYGLALDMELKPTVASNAAVAFARQAVGGDDRDGFPPTVWLPQRFPDNPGGLNFGPLYGYQQVQAGSRFVVWTFAHDVSGVARAELKVRRDADGVDPLADHANDTYAGGPGVGAWRAIPMQRRAMPVGNVANNPEFDASVAPTVIADVFWAEVDEGGDVLLDYYVEATDARGNVARSVIQHVWVGDGQGIGPGGEPGDPEGVHWAPAQPWRASPITVFSPDAGWLHWGVDGWHRPAEALWPQGTQDFADGMAVESPFQGPDGDGFYRVDLPALPVDVLDFVIRRADGSWDNNGGQDWHVPVRAEAPPPPPDMAAPVDLGAEDAGPPDPDDGVPPPDQAPPDPDDGVPAPDRGVGDPGTSPGPALACADLGPAADGGGGG
ncbi:MAG: hypothetical protein KC613_18505, partial [Myxococcales bacterium]|nr:hypothetical protein [Myxococcales bacterium]